APVWTFRTADGRLAVRDRDVGGSGGPGRAPVILAAALLALALPPASIRAQTPQQPPPSGESGTLKSGTVTGTVRDSLGLPVSAAQVFVAGLVVRASTGND